METQSTPNISRIIYGRTHKEWLRDLHTAHPSWEFRIGIRHVGAEHFRPEWPEFEIVSEYRPALNVRSRRFAVYARKRP